MAMQMTKEFYSLEVKATITINDNMSTFGFSPEITGSPNQLVLDKFLKINNNLKINV